MATLTEACPPEIFELIVEQLPLEDIVNVRLCSRSMAALATQETFKSFFASKKVNLSRSSLDKFVSMTAESPLVCLVEHLTIAGVAFDAESLEKMLQEKARWDTEHHGPIISTTQHKLDDDELAKTGRDLEEVKAAKEDQSVLRQNSTAADLLSQAFRNISSRGRRGCLPSLILTVVVFRKDAMTEAPPVEGGNWSAIGQAAADCFGSVMHALSDSQLPVDELDIFNSTYRCSLGLGSIDESLASCSRAAEALKAVKTLRLSICQQLLVCQPNIESAHQAAGARDSEIISRLLALCPNLRSLEIHWYDSGASTPSAATTRRSNLLEPTPEQSVHLGLLEGLTLRGISVRQEALLLFLRSLPAKSISLADIHMTEGTFASIVAHCTSEEAGLEHFRFDDIWEHRLVYFKGGKSKFPVLGGSPGRQTLERRGADVRKPIEYGFANRPLGSPQAYRCHQIRRRDYGPP